MPPGRCFRRLPGGTSGGHGSATAGGLVGYQPTSAVAGQPIRMVTDSDGRSVPPRWSSASAASRRDASGGAVPHRRRLLSTRAPRRGNHCVAFPPYPRRESNPSNRSPPSRYRLTSKNINVHCRVADADRLPKGRPELRNYPDGKEDSGFLIEIHCGHRQCPWAPCRLPDLPAAGSTRAAASACWGGRPGRRTPAGTPARPGPGPTFASRRSPGRRRPGSVV